MYKVALYVDNLYYTFNQENSWNQKYQQWFYITEIISHKNNTRTLSGLNENYDKKVQFSYENYEQPTRFLTLQNFLEKTMQIDGRFHDEISSLTDERACIVLLARISVLLDFVKKYRGIFTSLPSFDEFKPEERVISGEELENRAASQKMIAEHYALELTTAVQLASQTYQNNSNEGHINSKDNNTNNLQLTSKSYEEYAKEKSLLLQKNIDLTNELRLLQGKYSQLDGLLIETRHNLEKITHENNKLKQDNDKLKQDNDELKQEKTLKHKGKINALSTLIEAEVLNSINADIKQRKGNGSFMIPYTTLEKALMDDTQSETSMMVTAAFKKYGYLFDIIEDYLDEIYGKIGDISDKDILTLVGDIETELQKTSTSSYSSHRHINGWIGKIDKSAYPYMMMAIKRIHMIDKENGLKSLVRDQGSNCFNGLNGRALYQLMSSLKSI